MEPIPQSSANQLPRSITRNLTERQTLQLCYRGETWSAGTAVVIISIPIALLVLFAQRRIVSGLTAGSFR